MVNVTHNNNNGTTGLQGLLGILGNVHNSFFNGNNNGTLNLATHFGSNDFSRVKVDSLSNGSEHTELHQFLDDLCGSFLHRCGKLTDSNLLTDSNGDGGLLDFFKLESAKLISLGFSLGILRTAIVLRLLLDLLLALIVIIAHGVCGCNVLIALVILINVDVGSTGINLANLNGSAVRSLTLLFLLGSGRNVYRLVLGFCLLLRLLCFLFLFGLFLNLRFNLRLCLFLNRGLGLGFLFNLGLCLLLDCRLRLGLGLCLLFRCFGLCLFLLSSLLRSLCGLQLFKNSHLLCKLTVLFGLTLLRAFFLRTLACGKVFVKTLDLVFLSQIIKNKVKLGILQRGLALLIYSHFILKECNNVLTVDVKVFGQFVNLVFNQHV